MEVRRRGELEAVAEIWPVGPGPQPMSQLERLERWARVLERHQGPLRSLRGTEYARPFQRAVLREDDSPISVAYQDPVLRAAGLEGDTLADALRFFGLTKGEAHMILCYCHHGEGMSPREAARDVRYVARARQRAGRLQAWLAAVPVVRWFARA